MLLTVACDLLFSKGNERVAPECHVWRVLEILTKPVSAVSRPTRDTALRVTVKLVVPKSYIVISVLPGLPILNCLLCNVPRLFESRVDNIIDLRVSFFKCSGAVYIQCYSVFVSCAVRHSSTLWCFPYLFHVPNL